ncbi:MAG: translation initiation factor IF-2 [Lactobacillus sp.]|jgi:translation initiation factor IF-2|nr:translation initiation factor IF-2 [Lactobacillus sp.]MCI1480907.1 translation initiation factor IF-2 [Lactobacillus sp.]
MAKKRIYELAKELDVDNKILLNRAKKLGFDVKSHMSTLLDSQVAELKKNMQAGAAKSTDQADSLNKSKAKGKIKISVSALRKPAAKQPKRPKQANNRNRGQRRTETRQTAANTKRAARDLLQQFKEKQRAEQGKLAEQSKRARAEWHKVKEEPLRAAKEAVKKVMPAKQEADSANNERVIGPKILKPSPARLQTKNAEQEEERSRRSKNTAEFGRRRQEQTRTYEERRRRGESDRQLRKNKKKRRNRRAQEAAARPVRPTKRKAKPLPKTLVYEEGMNAQDLGKLLHREPAEIVKKLFMLGVMTNQNQSLDKDTIEIVAAEYGIEAKEKVHEDISDIDSLYAKEVEASKNSEHQVNRPPVVTIMGHVDHGKTTLLDRLRHTSVSEHEAGGITQKIGAYQVRLDDRLITFLDTPGHAAFSNMRARGAEITDIVVLVVAADDGVMPQTIEAIDHAKNAHVPIIVAVNKIDVPGANPQHVMEQLMKYGLVPEDWGGQTIFVNISAKTGKNVDELLQMILLQADVMELKADPDQKAIGTVVEARLSRGRGPVADVLVQQGTLHVGDPIVVGNTFGRVRVMTNDKGRRVKSAKPSMPVEITGLNDVPESADKLVVFEDEKTARSVGEQRAQNALEKQRDQVQHVTLDNLFDTMKRENMQEVNIVLKADVQGSVEALQQSLEKIDVKGVRVNIVHAGVGAINESDVTLAGASNAFIIGFNVRPTNTAKSQAEADSVDIRVYSIIYKVIDDVTAAMKGMLAPTFEEKVTGNLTVRETWKVSKLGTIAGAFVDSGVVTRDSKVRVIRDGIVKYDGHVASLKRFKDDVKEVKQGYDCGLMIENYNDIKVDDQLEAYEMVEVKPK